MTGLPCSGKSTLAKKLLEYIPKMEILDGDELVKQLKLDDWSRESRINHSERVAYLAKSFLERDISVCVAKISPYKEMRIAAKNILNQHFKLLTKIYFLNLLIRLDVSHLLPPNF